MAASSPSEFLTFFRHSTRRTSINAIVRPRPSRPFHSSFAAGLQQSSSDAGDIGADRKHVLDKGDHGNVQEQASNAGRQAKAAGDEQSSAHSQKDVNKSTAKAKKDHPEAPDVVIGMQDERGGKGNH